jgi:hypothetical protein
MAFALIDADKAPTPAIGGAGGALGFGSLAGRAVTLTENQSPWSCYPSDHFIGITDGTVPSGCPLNYLTTNGTIPSLLGATNHVVIRVTGGSTPEFKVSLNGQQYLDFHDSVPLPTHIFVGFTAGTGIGTERHLVSNIQISYTDTTSPPTTDPIVGDWNVTYGAPAVVTMTLSGGVYTVTAKTPVQVTGSSCDLPIGTVIATFSSIGGNAYSGQHGLWHTSDCSFGTWDPMSLTLSSDGNTLTGILAGSYGTVTFTKIASGVGLYAFGDSVAAGYGLAPLPGTNAQAYPALLAQKLNLPYQNFANVGACASRADGTFPRSNLYPSGEPRSGCSSFRSVSEQIASAPKTPQPRLITLTVGANDIQFDSCFEAALTGLGGMRPWTHVNLGT